MKLVVVGSVAFDTIHTSCGKAEEVLGGSATYFSVAAAAFTKVGLVAVVGQDFAENHEELLVSRGIDLGGLERTAGQTFRWEGRYSEDFRQRTTIRTELNVFENFNPVLPKKYQFAEILFLANIDPKLQLDVLDQMQSKPFVALDTMNLWIELKLPELKEVISRTQLFILNDEEALQLTGYSNIFDAAKELLFWGPDYVIIKRGEFGSAGFCKNQIFLLPAFPQPLVADPTGAGDTFAGGLMGYLSLQSEFNWLEIKKAMLYGTVIASFTVENFSLSGLISIEEEKIKQRYQQLQNYIYYQ